jgi:hypothetical protein
MGEALMCQCLLERKSTEGVIRTVTWLPEKISIKNKRLKRKNKTDESEDEWIIIEVYQPAMKVNKLFNLTKN